MISEPVITDPSQITNDWLTNVLTRSGALVTGRVSDFTYEAEASTWSANARIRVTYSDDATGSRPTKLFLKMCATSQGGFIVDSEVNYYARDYIGLADAPLVPCYAAVYSAEAQAYHLLLDDVSDTHQNTWELTPTLDYGQRLARALAALHAYRWTPNRWAEVGNTLPTSVELGRYVQIARDGLEAMLADIRGEAPDEWEVMVRAVFEHHPQLMLARAQDPRGITIVHGDVNKGNILWPLSGQGQVYLVDRQPFDWSLITWLAASDLAYMMAVFWDIEARRGLEMPVLREYHASLLRRGVTDYSWEQLLVDYRLALVQTIYIASEWCRFEETLHNMKWVWYRELQRGMAAMADWHCAELWA